MTIEELEAYGLTRMTPRGVEDFLSSQRFGILGLPAEGAPYLVPMSFGFDGASAIYFTYLVGPESRKTALTDGTDRAAFLVVDVDSPFIWESVSLVGALEAVPEEEWAALRDVLDGAWRPALLETARAAGTVDVYRLEIDEAVGVRHTGLPPGFPESAGTERD